MNTTISNSDGYPDAVDRLASQLGISRNELFRRAIEVLIEHGDFDAESPISESDGRKEPTW